MKTSNLCIIPARGGSKRITKKNIKDFFGKPVISYAIDTVIKTGIFEEVMVSTDDVEISQIALEFGANVPFLRSAETSDDFATTADVIFEVLSHYNNSGRFFDNVCCLYPCTPLIEPIHINESFHVLQTTGVDSVIPVVMYDYPIQRALKSENGKIKFFYPEFALSRSQDLEKSYHDAGQFYWLKTDVFNQKKCILTDNSGYLELSSFDCQDIDAEDDWKMAEVKYKIKYGKPKS
jgi:pseudaminic acid cytidylyltransferase